MAKSKSKVGPTLVTFLLDRSSSMGAIWDDTIDGFNAYLKTLKDSGENIKFTRLQFDQNHGCEIQKDCVAEALSKVSDLSKANYQPRGSTPLIEAAHKTIHAVEASLKKFDTKHNVVVCIQTDGQENASSHEYTWDGLKALIEQKTKDGWVFNFMGTGIDAYAQAGRMGVSAQNTVSTGTSREHVMGSMRAMAASNVRYAATAECSLAAFSPSERHASGEHTINGPSFRPLAASVPDLNLSPGGGGLPSSESADLDLAP
jgi:hypothetical protein